MSDEDYTNDALGSPPMTRTSPSSSSPRRGTPSSTQSDPGQTSTRPRRRQRRSHSAPLPDRPSMHTSSPSVASDGGSEGETSVDGFPEPDYEYEYDEEEEEEVEENVVTSSLEQVHSPTPIRCQERMNSVRLHLEDRVRRTELARACTLYVEEPLAVTLERQDRVLGSLDTLGLPNGERRRRRNGPVGRDDGDEAEGRSGSRSRASWEGPWSDDDDQ